MEPWIYGGLRLGHAQGYVYYRQTAFIRNMGLLVALGLGPYGYGVSQLCFFIFGLLLQWTLAHAGAKFCWEFQLITVLALIFVLSKIQYNLPFLSSYFYLLLPRGPHLEVRYLQSYLRICYILVSKHRPCHKLKLWKGRPVGWIKRP